MEKNANVIASAIIALGLSVLGGFVYMGMDAFASKDRQVVVRGLAEREVKADKVTWPLIVKSVGNDLRNVYKEVAEKNSIITSFLKGNGISDGEISVGAPQVFDREAQNYRSDAAYRYNATVVITVSSRNVDKVLSLMGCQEELLKSGVALSEDYQYRTVFEYTSLNDIKPEMIAEATVNARAAAAKFAEDSGSRVGRIKSASQGQFSISDRDAFTPWIKNVRVVSTVTYSLGR